MIVTAENKREVISQLQQKMLHWQGYQATAAHTVRMGLGPVEQAFPNGVFPAGSIHEFIAAAPEQAAASSGFIGGLLARLMRQEGVCLWISASRTLFPPAIGAFGVTPDRIVFIDMKRERDILWATEEALKCSGLAAVVTELRELDFAQSRRLQLVVEKSRVTGFVLRSRPLRIGNTACAARWQISPAPSAPEAGMPGVGLPRWRVELLKVRNGSPGAWTLEWAAGRFAPVADPHKQTGALPKRLVPEQRTG